MQVDGVWPLENLSADARLREKEKLLHTIHRIADKGLPSYLDEEGQISDVLLYRRVRSVSQLAALTHVELLEDNDALMQQHKKKKPSRPPKARSGGGGARSSSYSRDSYWKDR